MKNFQIFTHELGLSNTIVQWKNYFYTILNCDYLLTFMPYYDYLLEN